MSYSKKILNPVYPCIFKMIDLTVICIFSLTDYIDAVTCPVHDALHGHHQISAGRLFLMRTLLTFRSVTMMHGKVVYHLVITDLFVHCDGAPGYCYLTWNLKICRSTLSPDNDTQHLQIWI